MQQLNDRLPAISLKMKMLRSSLGKSEQKVVDYILENPEKVVYLSVAGLAENSHVSDATVIRACQKLGMSGYQELKLTLAQDIVTPIQNIHEEIEDGDGPKEILDKVFQSTIHALTFTHDTVRADAISDAADAIMAANRICIFGIGNSNSVALDLQHKLLRLGLNAYAYTDAHIQVIVASYLQKGDVVFAISHSGSSRDIVDSAKLAHDNGATVITLTNIGSSPLTRFSDIALHTASKETKYRIVALSSRIAQIAIIDTIYTIIAVRKQYVVEGFHNLEKALEQKKY